MSLVSRASRSTGCGEGPSTATTSSARTTTGESADTRAAMTAWTDDGGRMSAASAGRSDGNARASSMEYERVPPEILVDTRHGRTGDSRHEWPDEVACLVEPEWTDGQRVGSPGRQALERLEGIPTDPSRTVATSPTGSTSSLRTAWRNARALSGSIHCRSSIAMSTGPSAASARMAARVLRPRPSASAVANASASSSDVPSSSDSAPSVSRRSSAEGRVVRVRYPSARHRATAYRHRADLPIPGSPRMRSAFVPPRMASTNASIRARSTVRATRPWPSDVPGAKPDGSR